MLKIQKWTDRIATFVSVAMCAIMMVILLANVILRYIPGIGGFAWYMESSQYLNVWSMFIIGIAITVRGDHLRVNLVEDLCAKNPTLHKIQKSVVSLLMVLFYALLTYSSFVLSTKARQVISTMPRFKMAHVYMMIPIACALCCLAALVDWIVDLQKTKKEVDAQ